MRRLLGLGLFVGLLLTLGASGWAIFRSGPQPGPNPAVNVEIDSIRTALDNRISAARQSGQLNGIGYFAVLDEQHRLLIKQRRAEANGMPEDAKRQLLSDLARASANLDRHIGR